MNKHQICRICKSLCCLLLLLCVIAPQSAYSAATPVGETPVCNDGGRPQLQDGQQIVIIDIVIGGLND